MKTVNVKFTASNNHTYTIVLTTHNGETEWETTLDENGIHFPYEVVTNEQMQIETEIGHRVLEITNAVKNLYDLLNK